MTTQLIESVKGGRALLVTLSAAAIFIGIWIISLASRDRPVERSISNVTLSRRGKWLAAGTSQGSITVWDQGTGGAPRHFAFRRGPLNDLQFSSDERLLAIASRDLGVYDLEASAAPRLLRSDGRNYGTSRFSEDGQTIRVITGTGAIESLDTRSGATRLTICCSTIYGEVAFTPDGRNIASAGHWPGLWDARSGQLGAHFTKQREVSTFRPIAFDSVLDAIFMGSQDGRVYAWNLTTRAALAVSPALSDYVDTIAVLRGGWVAYAGFGKGVRLWNPQTGQARSLAGAHPTSNLVPAPDGTAIVFGTADGEIEIWDARLGQRLRNIKLPES
jgi:WD40 repeat protein